MRKNNKNKTLFGAIDSFKIPDNHYFLKIFLQRQKENKSLQKVENYFKKYSNILLKNSRPIKALSNLKKCTLFFYPPKAGFRLETALEGLVLIFLLDEMADNGKLSAGYRKKFLYELDKFIKNISLAAKIESKDIRQREMQEVWLNFFKKIYYRPGLKQEKWINAARGFAQGMISELKNEKYRTMKEYLKNAIPSSGAEFYWQSMITEAGRTRQNDARYDNLCRQIAKILRLANDSAEIKEDKNKITALNFCRGKGELKSVIEKELEKFQKMLRNSSVDKKIRVAMWRSAVFLYYFYQKKNF